MGFIRRTLEYAVGRSLSEAINHTVKKAILKDNAYADSNYRNAYPEETLNGRLIECPHCKTPSAPDKRFCPTCGSKLFDGNQMTEFVLCTCGKQNAPDANFCTVCGSRLSALEKNETTEQAPALQETDFPKGTDDA